MEGRLDPICRNTSNSGGKHNTITQLKKEKQRIIVINTLQNLSEGVQVEVFAMSLTIKTLTSNTIGNLWKKKTQDYYTRTVHESYCLFPEAWTKTIR